LWLPLLPFGCGACGQAFATLAELETQQAAEEENGDDINGGFTAACKSACSFCCEKFADVIKAQACERAHTAAVVPTGSEQEMERQQEGQQEEYGVEDEDL
jgi:hypothetical protein